MSEHRTLLLDGDVYAYQASALVEKAINWGSPMDDDRCLWTLHADENEAFDKADALIARVVDFVGADRVVIALSDTRNFRSDVLPTYKGNRKDTRKPLVLPRVREHFRETYEVFQRPGLEGDDVLGILMTATKAIPGEKICVTIDKDLKTIPGFHLNSNKMHEGIFEVTWKEADWYHLYQTLIGDTTDGYDGCPGIGDKTAKEFLRDPYRLVPETYTITRGARKGEEAVRWVKTETPDVWTGIVSLYEKAGLTEDHALQQARVARILRSSDYNFKTKEPILWTP